MSRMTERDIVPHEYEAARNDPRTGLTGLRSRHADTASPPGPPRTPLIRRDGVRADAGRATTAPSQRRQWNGGVPIRAFAWSATVSCNVMLAAADWGAISSNCYCKDSPDKKRRRPRRRRNSDSRKGVRQAHTPPLTISCRNGIYFPKSGICPASQSESVADGLGRGIKARREPHGRRQQGGDRTTRRRSCRAQRLASRQAMAARKPCVRVISRNSRLAAVPSASIKRS